MRRVRAAVIRNKTAGVREVSDAEDKNPPPKVRTALCRPVKGYVVRRSVRDNRPA